MQLLYSWLEELKPEQRVLDLGCGTGSFDYKEFSRAQIVGVDSDPNEMGQPGPLALACATAHQLPFRDRSFDLVICHHSIEHFKETVPVLHEVRRVLAANGRLFISAPDGGSFSDRLYRFLFFGGGHHQQFSFDSLRKVAESETQLRLASSTELYTSFIYIDKMNFLPAPIGRLPGPFPRRMRWPGYWPMRVFHLARFALNVAARVGDRIFGSHLSRYGWALAFDVSPGSVSYDTGPINVCVACGRGSEPEELKRIKGFFYRCPSCNRLNPLFRDRPSVKR